MKKHKQHNRQPYASAPTIQTPAPLPTVEAIRKRAHQIFLAWGNAPGSEVVDWLMAEREFKPESAKEIRH